MAEEQQYSPGASSALVRKRVPSVLELQDKGAASAKHTHIYVFPACCHKVAALCGKQWQEDCFKFLLHMVP
jgi:hypothetical protein